MTKLFRNLLLLVGLASSALAADFYEPKMGSDERTAIMDAMREPASKEVGAKVKFIGKVRKSGHWAAFMGKAETASGKPPKGDGADLLDLDFYALLHEEDGEWEVLSSGFAGDIGVVVEAKRANPEAPSAMWFGIKDK